MSVTRFPSDILALDQRYIEEYRERWGIRRMTGAGVTSPLDTVALSHTHGHGSHRCGHNLAWGPADLGLFGQAVVAPSPFGCHQAVGQIGQDRLSTPFARLSVPAASRKLEGDASPGGQLTTQLRV